MIRLPGFQCYPAQQGGIVVKVKHRLGPPATRLAIKLLKTTLGAGADHGIVQFYSKHDGATLYSQVGADAAGIRFFPIRQWAAATRHWRRRRGDGLDDWGNPSPQLAAGVVFAEIPRSGNYFLIRTEGRQTGKIFYDNHENATTKPLARTFESLLDMIWPDPAAFLCQMGGYTRYCDGTTATQWIPKKYLSNVPKQTWIC